MSETARRHSPPAPRPLDRSRHVSERTSADAGSPDQLEEAAAGVPIHALEQHRRSREIQEEHARHRDRINELYASRNAEQENIARNVRQTETVQRHEDREAVHPAEGIGAQRLAGERDDAVDLAPDTAAEPEARGVATPSRPEPGDKTPRGEAEKE